MYSKINANRVCLSDQLVAHALLRLSGVWFDLGFVKVTKIFSLDSILSPWTEYMQVKWFVFSLRKIGCVVRARYSSLFLSINLEAYRLSIVLSVCSPQFGALQSKLFRSHSPNEGTNCSCVSSRLCARFVPFFYTGTRRRKNERF